VKYRAWRIQVSIPLKDDYAKDKNLSDLTMAALIQVL